MFDFLKGKNKQETTDGDGGMLAKAGQAVASTIAATADANHAEMSPADGKYTVQPGDSLSKIAKRYNVSLKSLIAANPQVKNPDLIHPREVINLH